MEDKYIIDKIENLNIDIYKLLELNKNIKTLEVKDILIDLDLLAKLIKDAPIKKLIINNCVIKDYEGFKLLNNLEELELRNLEEIFDLYYLRFSKNLKSLILSNSNCVHLTALGYLDNLEELSLDKILVNSWVFVTKIKNLKRLYLSKEYNFNILVDITIVRI